MWASLGFKIEGIYIKQNCGGLSKAGCYLAMWNFLSGRPLQHINNARTKKIKTDCLDTSDIYGYVWN